MTENIAGLPEPRRRKGLLGSVVALVLLNSAIFGLREIGSRTDVLKQLCGGRIFGR